MAVDYKSTVFLPRTGFPMKAGLAQREPELLARWQKLGLYKRLRQESAGRPKFVANRLSSKLGIDSAPISSL